MKDMFVELATYARSLDRQLSLTRRDSSEISLISTSAHPVDENRLTEESHGQQGIEDSIDSLAQEFGNVALDRPESHFGKSGLFLLIESAIDARRDALGGRALMTHDVFNKLRRSPFWDIGHVSVQ